MTQRLFVAVVPPAGVVAEWDAFLDPRRDAAPEFRWTRPESWHLTLAFLASVADPVVEPLQEALDDVGRRTAPFAIEVGGAGAFPSPDRAKALWLAVASGSPALSSLATRCRNAASGCGIEVEGGQFPGHLTVARTPGVSAIRWLRILDALPPRAWTVDGFRLIRSRSLPGGAGYETVSHHPLAG